MVATIELRPAFEWTCEECGRNTYASMIRVEDPRVIADIEEEFGTCGALGMAPKNVTCPHCGTQYKTGDMDI